MREPSLHTAVQFQSGPHSPDLLILAHTSTTPKMSMKALGITAPGDEQHLNLHTIGRPTISADDVLVKISAFALNPVRA